MSKLSILLNALGAETLKRISPHLKDSDLLKLLEEIEKTDKAPIGKVKEILEKFLSALNEDDEFIFSQDLASSVPEHIPIVKNGKLTALDMWDDQSLTQLLSEEHPQSVALILAHLPVVRRVAIFKALPQSNRAEVTIRMATLDRVSPGDIDDLNELLRTHSRRRRNDDNRKGGVRETAELLSKLNNPNINSLLEEKDPELAEEIRKEQFIFEDLTKVDGRGIQLLLKEIENSIWVKALRKSSPKLLEKVMQNMSSRQKKILKEDIESLGPTPLSEIQLNQDKILKKCLDLKNQGKIQFDDEEGYV